MSKDGLGERVTSFFNILFSPRGLAVGAVAAGAVLTGDLAINQSHRAAVRDAAGRTLAALVEISDAHAEPRPSSFRVPETVPDCGTEIPVSSIPYALIVEGTTRQGFPFGIYVKETNQSNRQGNLIDANTQFCYTLFSPDGTISQPRPLPQLLKTEDDGSYTPSGMLYLDGKTIFDLNKAGAGKPIAFEPSPESAKLVHQLVDKSLPTGGRIELPVLQQPVTVQSIAVEGSSGDPYWKPWSTDGASSTPDGGVADMPPAPSDVASDRNAGTGQASLLEGKLGDVQAKYILRNLHKSGVLSPAIMTRLEKLYAELPNNYQNRLKVLNFPIRDMTQVNLADGRSVPAFTFVQPINIGETSSTNFSKLSNYAMFVKGTLLGITSVDGKTIDSELENALATMLRHELARNVNTHYMRNTRVAQPDDFEIVYDYVGGIRTVTDIRVKTTKIALYNTKARGFGLQRNIVVDKKKSPYRGHLIWPTTQSSGSGRSRRIMKEYPFNLAHIFVNPDAQALAEYSKEKGIPLTQLVPPREPTEDPGLYGSGDAQRPTLSADVGKPADAGADGLPPDLESRLEGGIVPEGGAPSVGEGGVPLVPDAGVRAPLPGAVVRAAPSDLSPPKPSDDLTPYADLRRHDLTPLPPKVVPENERGVIVALTPRGEMTLTDVLRDCLPGGETTFFTRQHPHVETVLDVNGHGDEIRTPFVDGKNDNGRSFVFDPHTPYVEIMRYSRWAEEPERGYSEQTFRFPVCPSTPDGSVGVVTDAAIGDGSAADGPARLFDKGVERGDGSTLLPVAIPVGDSLRPGKPPRIFEQLFGVGHDDIQLVPGLEIPGNQPEPERRVKGLIKAGYEPVYLVRPTNDEEADITTHHFTLDGVLAIPVGNRSDYWHLLTAAGAHVMFGDTRLDGASMQNMVSGDASFGVGVAYRQGGRDAILAYLLPGFLIGGGETSTRLPGDGTQTLDTSHLDVGGLLRAGVAGRYDLFSAFIDGECRFVYSMQDAGFNGSTGAERTENVQVVCNGEGRLNLDVGKGVTVFGGGSVDYQFNRYLVNGGEEQFLKGGPYVGARIRLPSGAFRALELRGGYEFPNNLLGIRGCLDVPHAKVCLETGVSVGGQGLDQLEGPNVHKAPYSGADVTFDW